MHTFRLPISILVVLLASLEIVASRSDAAETRAKPNIIVILADDYGWGSVGCYGAGGLKTPNLDRLAAEGRRFTNGYACGSVCSPTRYGLMTGRYYWRTSIKDGEVLPGNAPLHIETDRLTLGSVCKTQGYRTAAFGKWHLGLGTEVTRDWSVELKPGPLEIGFDYFFGLAANPWNGPHSFIENHELLGKIPGQPAVISGNKGDAKTSGIEKQWQEDQIVATVTGKVVDWIEQNHEQPFFVYFAPTAIHEPVVPNPKFKGSKYGIYGDFIEELDGSVGQVLAALDKHHLAENTLIIFTSDNGGVVNANNPNASAAMKAGLAINGILRGGKHDVWEGGFREPFLVRWPGHVPAGTTSDQVICCTDVLATLADVVGAPLTSGQAEDSFNALRAFTETEPGPPIREHLVLQAADATYAIRIGNQKLIERVGKPPFEHRNRRQAQLAERRQKNGPKANELFDLKADPSEASNIASANPEQATGMKRKLVEARDQGFTRPGAGK